METMSPIPFEEALKKLKAGNERYLSSRTSDGDISPALRKKTAEEGQFPYAVIFTCSDSRVIPESIFSAGIGELFVIRVAGNVTCDTALGSIEYAVSHLKTRFVLVLGHDGCGAIGAALSGGGHGYIKTITDEIQSAIGQEKSASVACRKNVERAVEKIKTALKTERDPSLLVAGAIYRLSSGEVEFL